MMKAIYFIVSSAIVVIYLLCLPPTTLASDADCNKDIKAFLDCNNPQVIKYLMALTRKDIGKSLEGVRLTDGDLVLKGHIFLGEAKGFGKGIHLFLFEFKKNRVAYAWVQENGTGLGLPVCPETVSHESAYMLSGDVYTWKTLQPRDGVVQIMCIREEWIRKLE